jgi:hypothetical protein
MKFKDLNPMTMPGFGDPETWGGRMPLESREYDEPIDWDRLTQDEMIDDLPEEPNMGFAQGVSDALNANQRREQT